jgi:hypothetical protein
MKLFLAVAALALWAWNDPDLRQPAQQFTAAALGKARPLICEPHTWSELPPPRLLQGPLLLER